MRPKLLVVADATVPTGFARVCHALCDRLQLRWDVSVIGIGYYGDPHPYPYPIYPAFRGGDIWGIGRYEDLAAKLVPDVTLVLQDPWNVAPFVAHKGPGRLVAYIPVDAEHQIAAPHLRGLDLAIAYTTYGETQLRQSGYDGPLTIIPHGVDRTVFAPTDKIQARLTLGMPASLAYNIVMLGAVNRNQPRKRLDLTLYAFQVLRARWPHRDRPLQLLVHADPRDPMGMDLVALAHWLGIADATHFVRERGGKAMGTAEAPLTDAQLAVVYSAMDVQVSTSTGEGWGLSSLEGMACGVPQVLPEHSALAEWAAGAAYFVPARQPSMAPQIHTIGRVVDYWEVAEALEELLNDPDEQAELRQRGLALADDPRFNWDNIADRFDEALRAVVEGTDVPAMSLPEEVAV